MAEPQGLHRCPVCFKTYKRREHLQRHRSSHTSERPHRCALCGAAFQRSDVLKRHVQTCDGACTPSSSRRRACDRCVRQKKACNSTQPCLNCEKRSVECHYSNAASTSPTDSTAAPAPADSLSSSSVDDTVPQPGPSHPPPVDLAFEHVPFDDLDTLIQQTVSQFPLLEGQPIPDAWFETSFPQSSAPPVPGIEAFHHHHEPVRSSPVSRYRGYSFSFLSDFTSRTGLVSSFECATLSQRQQIVSAFHHSYHEQQPPDFLWAIQPLPPPPEDTQLQDPRLLPGAGLADHGLSSWSSWLHNPIVIKLQQVVLLVKDVVLFRPNNSTITLTWSSALEQRCLHFFSPPRFAKFIELYWSVWHPNVNILHRPTFDPTNAKSILLAGMALIGKFLASRPAVSKCSVLMVAGACVSPDPVDNEDAKMWFNCVEEMVFADDDFCRDIEPPAVTDISIPVSTPANQRKLQALQAAYLVCLYQNWEGTDASKRRIRRHRFSTVVSVCDPRGDLSWVCTHRHLDCAGHWHRHGKTFGLQQTAQARVQLV